MKNVEEIYGFGRLQGAVTLYQELVKRGLGIDDLADYVERKKVALRAATGGKTALRYCPECKAALVLEAVNQGPRDQTGDNSASVWSCPRCYWQEYSKLTVANQLVKYVT